MPIIRTYACPECNHMIEVTLSADQWDDPPPSCPACDRREMQQEFKPPAIRGVQGSHRERAASLAREIAAEDYGVANMTLSGRQGERAKVRYKDERPERGSSGWDGKQMQIGREALEAAVQLGRASRLKHGSGLDILKHNLETGAQPDLIEVSKRRSHRIW